MAVRTVVAAIAAVAALTAAGPAAAQFGSDSYNFLKAVKDRDGDEAQKYLSQPGFTGIDTRDEATGETALHVVTKRRDVTWLSFLLAKGARIDARDRDGATALLDAATIGWPEGEGKLIDYGAKPDVANNAGETPLMRAAAVRDLDGVRMLLAAGADPAARDHITGKTARDYALGAGRGDAVVRLLDAAKPKKAAIGPHI